MSRRLELSASKLLNMIFHSLLLVLEAHFIRLAASQHHISIQPESCTIASGISSYKHVQHTQDPARCVQDSGVTDFAGCLAWDHYITSCGDFASASEARSYWDCYCQTGYLDAIYRSASDVLQE